MPLHSMLFRWHRALVSIYERVIVNLAGRDGSNSRERVREKIVVVLNGRSLKQ